MPSKCLNRAHLSLQWLEDRAVPANISWTGLTNSDWNTNSNWDGNVVPGANDTVLLSGTPANAPTIAAGQSATINYIQLQESATFDLTINGRLTTKGSLLQPTDAHGFVGAGRLSLEDTATAPTDHVWHSGYMKVQYVSVDSGGVLEVRSTFGQLGPDTTGPGAQSQWWVGTSLYDSAGTMLLRGDHFIGFDSLEIGTPGTLICEAGGLLRDVGMAEGGIQGNRFFIENHNRVEIAEGQALSLRGGWYKQTALFGSIPVTVFNPGGQLLVGNFLWVLDGAPPYAIDVQAGKLVAYEMTTIRATTDIRVSDATVEFYSPGVFTRSNGPQTISKLNLSAGEWPVKKEVLIKNTPLKWLDYNPVGRYTSTTQVGGQVIVDANMKLEGTTELAIRVNVGDRTTDRILATGSLVALNGNQLKLTVNLRNAAGRTGLFAIDNFVWATTVTAPNPIFGGGVFLSGDSDGWSPMVSNDGHSLDLTLTKM